MEIQLNNLDFAITVSTFSDQVSDKLQILAKMELQFLRKFQHRVQIAGCHSEMLFDIRRILSTVEEMHKDVRNYFVDMKLEFVYDFMRKIQTLMVVGYNHLSQALLVTLDMYQEERKKNKQVKPVVIQSSQTKKEHRLLKEENKRLEYIDQKINILESEEGRLLDEMAIIYDRMMLQKGFIEKLKPSLASKELQEMKDHIETVMENNKKLFEQTYIIKFFEFHNHIQKLDKPQKFTQVYNNFNQAFKENFIDQTIKAAKRIQHDRRFNPQRMRDAQIQTIDVDLKIKNKEPIKRQLISIFNKTSNAPLSFLAKQKKLYQKMNIELNTLQKQNISLNEELNSYKEAEKQFQLKYKESIQKFQVVQSMYHQTKMQLDDLKRQQKFQTNQLILQNNKIKQQLTILTGKGSLSSPNSKDHVQTQKMVPLPDLSTKSKNHIVLNQYSGSDKETQTHEEYLLPNNDDEVIKFLKIRNEKAIIMLNEKDKKIRDISTKITMFDNQNTKIKSVFSMLVGIVQDKLISSKQEPKDVPEPKQSILEMNSQQIETKIQKVIRTISLKTNDFDSSQKDDLNLPRQEKFKKVTSIKSKPLQTLQDEQLENDKSNQELTNVQITDKHLKTISNFASNTFDEKKKKRLNVMAILNRKINQNQARAQVECQTQPIYVQGEYCHCNSVQDDSTYGYYNHGYLIQKNQDFVKNSQKKEICPQIMTEHKNRRGNFRNNPAIKNYTETRNQKALNDKKTNTNKTKNNRNSNRSTNVLISNSQKKNLEQKIDLNTFEKFKIQERQNQTQCFSFSKSFGKNGLSQYLQTQKKIVNNYPITQRNDPNHIRGIQTQQNFRTKNAQGYFGEFTQDSNSRIRHKDDETQKQSNLGKSLASSRINSSLALNKQFNIRQKSTIKKGKHNRNAFSQIPSPIRPITETSQCDKQNQSNFNRQNFTYTTTPRSLFKNIEYMQKHNDFQNPQSSMTFNPPFFKFKAQQTGSSQKIMNNKKTLLLSIQTFNPKVPKVNRTDDMLLQRYLTKIINKWGKQKIKQAISSRLEANF